MWVAKSPVFKAFFELFFVLLLCFAHSPAQSRDCCGFSGLDCCRRARPCTFGLAAMEAACEHLPARSGPVPRAVTPNGLVPRYNKPGSGSGSALIHHIPEWFTHQRLAAGLGGLEADVHHSLLAVEGSVRGNDHAVMPSSGRRLRFICPAGAAWPGPAWARQNQCRPLSPFRRCTTCSPEGSRTAGRPPGKRRCRRSSPCVP